MPRARSEHVQRKRAKRRRLLVETAWSLICEDGYERFSFARVATELELTTGSLYYYFESREHLLVAVQLHVLGELEGAVRSAVEDWRAHPALQRRRGDTRALHDLARLASFILELPTDRPRIDVIVGLALSPIQALADDVAPEYGRAIRRALAAGAVVIDEARAAGVLTPGDSLTRMIALWMALQGPVRLRKLARVVPELAGDHGVAIAHAVFLSWGAPDKGLKNAWRLAGETRS